MQVLFGKPNDLGYQLLNLQNLKFYKNYITLYLHYIDSGIILSGTAI